MEIICLRKSLGISVLLAIQTKNHQNGNGPPPVVQQPPSPLPPRPQLNRLDSRSSFPIRPGFPNQPLRPPLIRQGPPGQPFIQRPPGPPRPPFPPNQGTRPINPNFRPPTPFPRPPLQGAPPRPPGIFQQRSAPTFGPTQRAPFDGELIRSQTLEATAEQHFPKVHHEDGRLFDDPRPAMNVMKARSISVADPHHPLPPPQQHVGGDEERRRSISSVGSVDERRSISESTENLHTDRKSENDQPPSRPESRAGSKMMNRIVEDEIDGKAAKSPSPHVDFMIPTDTAVVNKSPSPVPKTEETTKSPIPPSVQNARNVPDPVKEPIKIQNGAKNLDLKGLTKIKSPSKAEGDNDSGVDESTQGNDQSSNGDHSSPRKPSSGKIASRTSSTTPTKNRSLSRGSKSPSLKSPDSIASTPGTTEKKKLPMNKVQVGSAPSPNLKVVKSKIGSLENATYRPGGGKVKIESKKLDFTKAAPRIEAKNDRYVPKGGDKKIQQQKLQWNAKSKIGSLENTTHKPKGGDKKIESVKLDFKEKAKPKVGSKDNMKHTPGGGDVKIENKKLDIKVQSKIGSMDNVKHRPGGGDKKIFDDKDYLKQRSTISSENHSLSGSQNSLPSQQEVGGPVADENLNQER